MMHWGAHDVVINDANSTSVTYSDSDSTMPVYFGYLVWWHHHSDVTCLSSVLCFCGYAAWFKINDDDDDDYIGDDELLCGVRALASVACGAAYDVMFTIKQLGYRTMDGQ